MNKEADSKVIFKFRDAQIFVKRLRLNPAYLLAHKTTLLTGAMAKYYLMRVELKSFTFPNGSQSLLIDNVVLGPYRSTSYSRL